MSAGDYYGSQIVNSTWTPTLTAWCNIHGQFFAQFNAPIVCPTCQMQQYARQVQQQMIQSPLEQVVPWVMAEPLTIPPGEVVAVVDASRHHRSCALRKGGSECTC